MKGSCHCGKVEFLIEVNEEDILKHIYRCDCSLCIKKGIIMKPLPKEKFSLIQGEEFLNSYKWNKKIKLTNIIY